MIVKTVISAQPILKHSYHACFPSHDIALACFELLGFDILLDHRLKPYVLEVNHSPSFHTDAQIDQDVKEPLLMDTFRILNLSHADRAKVLLEDKQRIRDRLLQGLKTAEENNSNSRSQTPASKFKKMLESQAKWEKMHMGNFRLIYPAENAAYYEPFFNQNVGSLYQKTASSKAREECARQWRESRRNRVLEEIGKKESDRKLHQIRRVYCGNRITTSAIRKRFYFEPEPINKLEEDTRRADMANREALLRHVDLNGFLYHSLRRNGALSERDRRVYGEEGPIPPTDIPKKETYLPEYVHKKKQSKKLQIAKMAERTLPLTLGNIA